jgi:hypothetical protein
MDTRARATLKKLTAEMTAFLEWLRVRPKKSMAIKRLLGRHANGVHLTELDPRDPRNRRLLAINFGKGREISVCLRKSVESGEIANDDVLLYIVLHELAHSMQLSTSKKQRGASVHNKQFRQYEQELLDLYEVFAGMDVTSAFYKPHCGVFVPDTSVL